MHCGIGSLRERLWVGLEPIGKHRLVTAHSQSAAGRRQEPTDKVCLAIKLHMGCHFAVGIFCHHDNITIHRPA